MLCILPWWHILKLTPWVEYSSISLHHSLSCFSHWLILRPLFFCADKGCSTSFILVLGLDHTPLTDTNCNFLRISIFVSSLISCFSALMLECSFKNINLTILCCVFKSSYHLSSNSVNITCCFIAHLKSKVMQAKQVKTSCKHKLFINLFSVFDWYSLLCFFLCLLSSI